MEAINTITKTKIKAIMKRRICLAMNARYLPVLLLFFICSPTLLAQSPNEGKIIGKITNEAGEPLVGASITVAGTTRSAMTTANGAYTLSLPPGIYTLDVSFVSYKSQRLSGITTTANAITPLNITLKADAKDLDNVIVTALGITRQQKSLGYAAHQISGQSLTEATTNNWLTALSGKVPGINLQRIDGPTGSVNIVLRGNKSLQLGNNAALIVIDGVVISNQVSGNGGGNNLAAESPVDFGSTVSDINPDDIENISVLPGAGATALYGSRGAGGAIIITTKSGSNKKGVGLTLNSSVTFDQVNRWPDYQYEYGQGGAGGATYYSYGTTDDGPSTAGTSQGWGPKFDPNVMYYQYDPVTKTGAKVRTPWVPYKNNRKDLFRTGVTYNNSISIDGGNENTSMRLSVNNLVNKWILPNTGYNRTSVNLSVQHKMGSKVKINAKVNYYNKQSDNLPNLGYDNKTLSYFMIAHSPNVNLDWYRDYWITKDVLQRRPFGTGVVENPFFSLYEQLNPMTRNGVFGNVGFTYNMTPELTLSAKTGIDFYQDVSSGRQPKSSQRFANGMYKEQTFLRHEINSDFLLSYNKKVHKDLKLGVSFGGNRMSEKTNRSSALVNQLVLPGVYKLNNGVERPVYSGAKTARAINSLYGFINLAYKEYLFLDITGRNDWSSTLPEKNESYFYPSVNLSAVLTDIFDLKSSTLTFAKLRLSVADAGIDNRSMLPIAKYYNSSPFPSSLTNPTSRPHYDLKNERTRSYEAGGEARLFNNKAGLDVAVYIADTYNQILNVPVDESTGYLAAVLNAGLVRNKGVEVQLWAKPVTTKNFGWKVNGNWSMNKGRIVRLSGIGETEVFQIRSGPGGVALIGALGGEIGDIYGRGYVRAPDGQIVYENGLPQIGTEVTKRGNANPDFKAGIQNEFTYKNFRLSILFDGEFGSDKFSLTYAALMGGGKLKATIPGRDEGGILGNGVKQTTDGKYVPNDVVVKAVSNYYATHYDRANTEANMFDASFIKLREVRLDYNIKVDYLKKLGVKNASLGLFGRDLFTISRWPIFDPENSTMDNGLIVQGFEVGQLPGTRSMGINLKVSF
jgi:TonB-linked SusC/RagA family outer membrane protein